MQVEILNVPSAIDWAYVKGSALETIGKEMHNPVTDEWKRKILISEHSPIRDLVYKWRWIDIPYWVAMHIRTHHIGIVQDPDINYYVESQRNDRQKQYDRGKAPQDALVNFRMSANAQSIINISRRRLCLQASKETIEAWLLFLNKLYDYEPLLARLCVPNCIYRNGICSEPDCCGYINTKKYLWSMDIYWRLLHQEDKNG